MDYKTETLTICLVLYSFAFLYATLQSLFRCWMESERELAKEALDSRFAQQVRPSTATTDVLPQQQQQQRQQHTQLLPQQQQQQQQRLRVSGKELTVSPLNRSRLRSISQNLAVAFFLRVVWLLLTIFHVAPRPEPGTSSEACKNYHTLVSACNRLCQLLFFTSYLSMVGYIANVLRAYEKAKRERVGLRSEHEIAAALSQSTNRRRPGEVMVTIPNLFASNDLVPGQSRVEDEVPFEDQQGFNALCSILCMLMTPDVVQLLLNFWVYVIISILLVVQWFECDHARFTALDNAQTITIAFFFAILSLMYLRYGAKLLGILQRIHHPLKWRFVASILLVTVLSIVLFLIRGVLFLLQPMFAVTITGALEKVMYPWFFYALPELLPGLVMLHLMTPRARRVRAFGPSTPLIPPADMDSMGDTARVTPDDESLSSSHSAISETEFGSFRKPARLNDDIGAMFWA